MCRTRTTKRAAGSPPTSTIIVSVESEKRFVRLRVSAKGIRVIDKRGIDVVLGELRARGEKV